jgi:hypothetical protein
MKTQKEYNSPINIILGRHLVQMIGGLEPEISGPYLSEETKDAAAKIIYKKMGDEDNIFRSRYLPEGRQ